MAQTFISPRWFNGYHYELSLPQDWTSKDDNDGERKFISHWSPLGSRLILTVSPNTSVSWTSRYVPRDEPDPYVRTAYLLAEQDECVRPAYGSVLVWILRSLLRSLGRRPRLVKETLGRSCGFTHRIRSGPGAGWYGNFANDSWIVYMRFRTAAGDAEAEIQAARGVISTLRFVKETSDN
jgi:hypothetical protein